MKSIIILLACIFLAANLLYAGNGDLLVNGKIGIGTTSPGYSLDVNGKIGINNTQMLYLPDQTIFSGSLIIGDGGGSLSHSSGYDGQGNTFVGMGAGSADTTGCTNFAVGSSALHSNTTGSQNLALGASALVSNTDGGNNTAIGTSSLANNYGSENTAIGTNTFYGTAYGWYNVAIGYGAGYNPAVGLTSLLQSTFLGANATAGVDGLSNVIAIGCDTQATQSNQVTLGNSSITQTLLRGNVGIGTTNLGAGGSNALLLAVGVKPTGLSGTAGLYAKVSNNITELFSFDEAGNETQQTAHAGDAPEWMYDAEDGLPMIVREVQHFLGYVRYTNQTRQAKLAGMTDTEKLGLSSSQRTCVFKESFADHEIRTGEQLTVLVWEDEQAAIKQKKDAERQALIDRKAGLADAIASKATAPLSAKGASKLAFGTEVSELQQQQNALIVPEVYEIKPIPTHLQAALYK